MPRGKKKKAKLPEDPVPENNEAVTERGSNINIEQDHELNTDGNSEDSDEEPQVQLPSQEHCTWLLNIIKIHATKIAKELLQMEVTGLKLNFSNQIQELKEKLSAKEQESTTLQQEVRSLKGTLINVERKLAKSNEKLSRLEAGIDNIEQRQNSTSVKVVGLQEKTNEDLKKK